MKYALQWLCVRCVPPVHYAHALHLLWRIPSAATISRLHTAAVQQVLHTNLRAYCCILVYIIQHHCSVVSPATPTCDLTLCGYTRHPTRLLRLLLSASPCMRSHVRCCPSCPQLPCYSSLRNLVVLVAASKADQLRGYLYKVHHIHV